MLLCVISCQSHKFVCSSHIIILYSCINLIISDLPNSVVIAVFFLFFSFLFMCAFVLSCWRMLYFNLTLMLTGCLALLAPMVIPGSQYSNVIIYIFCK